MLFAEVDYPLLNIIWTMLIFFGWIIWFWILIKTLADVFRRRDIGGGKKTLWVIFMCFTPFLGVLIYLLLNGPHMADRDLEQAQKSQAQFDSYVRSVATTSGGGSGAVADIDRAKQLLDSGAITQAEFDALKAKALA